MILEREEGVERKRGREGGRNIDVRNFDQLPPVCVLTGDQTCNLGMRPDWESNL